MSASSDKMHRSIQDLPTKFSTMTVSMSEYELRSTVRPAELVEVAPNDLASSSPLRAHYPMLSSFSPLPQCRTETDHWHVFEVTLMLCLSIYCSHMATIQTSCVATTCRLLFQKTARFRQPECRVERQRRAPRKYIYQSYLHNYSRLLFLDPGCQSWFPSPSTGEWFDWVKSLIIICKSGSWTLSHSRFPEDRASMNPNSSFVAPSVPHGNVT